MSQKFGIDVSHWQGDFNFARAKSNEGVEFAILKAGGGDAGLYKDSKFEANYEKCEDCGLPKGAYFYGKAEATRMNGCGVNASIVVKIFRGGIIENFVAEFVHNFPGKNQRKKNRSDQL